MKIALHTVIGALLVSGSLHAQTPNYSFSFETGRIVQYTGDGQQITSPVPANATLTDLRTYTGAGGSQTHALYRIYGTTDLAALFPILPSNFWGNVNSKTSNGLTIAVIHSAKRFESLPESDTFGFYENGIAVFKAGTPTSVLGPTWEVGREIYVDFNKDSKPLYTSSVTLWDPVPELKDWMITYFTFQPDGQARIDQFDLDNTRWQAGLIDSSWPLVKGLGTYDRVPFDHFYIGGVSGIAEIADVDIFTTPLTTDQMVKFTLETNSELGYLSSSSASSPNAKPVDSGYWLPVITSKTRYTTRTAVTAKYCNPSDVPMTDRYSVGASLAVLPGAGGKLRLPLSCGLETHQLNPPRLGNYQTPGSGEFFS